MQNTHPLSKRTWLATGLLCVVILVLLLLLGRHGHSAAQRAVFVLHDFKHRDGCVCVGRLVERGAGYRLTDVKALLYGDRQTGLSRPRFSPDGKRILYLASEMDSDHIVTRTTINLVDADGHNPRCLTPDGVSDQWASFSPNGTKILFASNRVSNAKFMGYSIFTVNLDGSGVTQLTHCQSDDGQPSFSPDGKLILYYSRTGVDYKIFLMQADGNNQRQLQTAANEEVNLPLFSANGKQVYFIADPGGPPITGPGSYSPPSSLHVINLDGSGEKALPVQHIGRIYLGPYGDRLLFTRSTDDGIYTIRPDGTRQSKHPIAAKDPFDPLITWSMGDICCYPYPKAGRR